MNKRLIIIIVIAVMLIAFAANQLYAEKVFSAKFGAMAHVMKHAHPSIYEEVSYELRNKDFGVEFSAGHYQMTLNGEEALVKGPDGAPLEWGNDSSQGTLTGFPFGLVFKKYISKFYIGAGGGLQLLSFKEKYDGHAKVKQPYCYQFVAGYDMTKHFSIEVKQIISDLNIESGAKEIGVAEDKSRLDLLLILLKYRW